MGVSLLTTCFQIMFSHCSRPQVVSEAATRGCRGSGSELA